MSDRAKGLIVALEKDLRVEDDLQPILTAIKMIKGVAGVDISISTSEDWMNRQAIRREIESKILEALYGRSTP